MRTAMNRDKIRLALLSHPKTARRLANETGIPIGSVHGVLYAGTNGFVKGDKLPSGAYLCSVTDTPKVLMPAAVDADHA